MSADECMSEQSGYRISQGADVCSGSVTESDPPMKVILLDTHSRAGRVKYV
jgi:hypothetical protein